MQPKRDFQVTASARPSSSTDAPPALLSARWLRALFHDLYGRSPLKKEREFWLGKSLDEFLQPALADEAVWRQWLESQLYYFMLIDRFEPVGTGLDRLPSLLSSRGISPRDALHRIALSTSFELRNPGADTFVTVVMEQFCGIEVQRSQKELELGKAAYDGGTATFLGSKASSQSDVIEIAVRHRRAAQHLVSREFERICHAPCPKKDSKTWAKGVWKKPLSMFELYREWFASDAYAERVARGAPLSNRAWVRSVFVDLGDRVAPDEEVEPLRGALDSLGDPAPLRSLIVRMLLDAEGTKAPRGPAVGEPDKWVKATFARLLGRPPADDELSEFVAVCSDGSNGPELVLYALLTSQEYQVA